MWPFNEKRYDFWQAKFNALATYNGEVNRGILHSKEYDDKMKVIQAEYDARAADNQKAR